MLQNGTAKCELKYEGCTTVSYWIINLFPFLKDMFYYSCDNCHDKFVQCRGYAFYKAERYDFGRFIKALSYGFDNLKGKTVIWDDIIS